MRCLACNTEIKDDEPALKIMNSEQMRVHFKCASGVQTATEDNDSEDSLQEAGDVWDEEE